MIRQSQLRLNLEMVTIDMVVNEKTLAVIAAVSPSLSLSITAATTVVTESHLAVPSDVGQSLPRETILFMSSTRGAIP